jgi:ABC-2 type transport system ATP-binding protein
MSHHADLLLLDEPTSGLDPVARSEILEILADYTSDENKTVFFSSHITSDIEKIADYVVFIQDGRIVLAEETNLLLEKYALIKCGEDVFAQIDTAAVIGYRNHRFGCELLTQDANIVNGLSGEYTIEKPTIEDIMVFYKMR